MTSEKQIKANRANAEKSTGPRTEAGKARSSRNAETHSAYSKEAAFLENGPYAQSRDQAEERRRRFLEEQDCQGILESQLGSSMWIALEKIELTDIYATASASGLIRNDLRLAAKAKDRRVHEDLAGQWLTLYEMAKARSEDTLDAWVEDQEFVGWESYARLIKLAFIPDLKIPGVWDDDTTPTDEDTWRKIVVALLADGFAATEAIVALWRLYCQEEARTNILIAEEKSIAASTILNAEAELERPQAHLWRRYIRAAHELERVQTRRRARDQV